MAVVTLKVSEILLREDLLRLGPAGRIAGARAVEQWDGSIHTFEFILDDPDIPEDIVEIEPQYTRSPGRDPVNLSGISYRHADGRWERPEPIETAD